MASVFEAPPVRILDSSPIYVLGEFDGCLISDWRLQPTKREFDRRNVALMEIADRLPGACAYLEMIEPASTPPPAPLRKSGMDAFRSLGSKLSCVSIVVYGTAVRVTLIRAVLTGMTFIVPQFQPLRVFKESETSARWVQERLGRDAEFQRRLVSAVESLRPPTSGA